MELLIWSAALIASLTVLVKASDYFTIAAERLGFFFGLSGFVIGATIVAFGSSMPELATALFSLKAGVTNFAVDNIVGSNIANSLLVVGLAAVTAGVLNVKEKLLDVTIPFFFVSTAIFILFVMDGTFNAFEGVISLAMLGVFIVYTIKTGSAKASEDEEKKNERVPLKTVFRSLGVVVVSIFVVVAASKYTIDSVVQIAELLNVAPAIITMLAVAFGTSLPEIIISVRAVMTGRHSIALGNVFGSNTFNVLAVAGIPSLFGTLTVSSEVFLIGLPFLIVASVAFIFIVADNHIKKWEGILLLIVYLAFVGKITGMF